MTTGAILDTTIWDGRLVTHAADGRAVTSVSRALTLLECLADAGGALGVSQLADSTGLPLPTIHRLLRSLLDEGYVRQEPSRRYALGARLVRLGDVAASVFGASAVPCLQRLVDEIGETANLARLEGDAVAYVAQVPSPHSMRMFTEVGRHVLPHCTGVGKALLAGLPDDAAHAIVNRTGLPSRTKFTITSESILFAELENIRHQGFAVDEGEQEVGVRCIAVRIPDLFSHLAVSVSGPSGRLTTERVGDIVPHLLDCADRIAKLARGTE